MEELPLGFGMALAQNPRAMEYFSKQTKEKQAEIWHTRIQFNPAMKCMPMCRALAIFKPTAGAPRGKMATLSRRHGEHRIGNARQPSLDCPPRSLYPIEQVFHMRVPLEKRQSFCKGSAAPQGKRWLCGFWTLDESIMVIINSFFIRNLFIVVTV